MESIDSRATYNSIDQMDADLTNLISYLDDRLIRCGHRLRIKSGDSSSSNSNSSNVTDADLARQEGSEFEPGSEFEASGLLESIISQEFKSKDENKIVATLTELRKAVPAIRSQALLCDRSVKDCVRLAEESARMERELRHLKLNGQRAINIVADRYNQELKYVEDTLHMEAEDSRSELLRAIHYGKSNKKNSKSYSPAPKAKARGGFVGDNDVKKKGEMKFDLFPEIYESNSSSSDSTTSDMSSGSANSNSNSNTQREKEAGIQPVLVDAYAPIIIAPQPPARKLKNNIICDENPVSERHDSDSAAEEPILIPPSSPTFDTLSATDVIRDMHTSTRKVNSISNRNNHISDDRDNDNYRKKSFVDRFIDHANTGRSMILNSDNNSDNNNNDNNNNDGNNDGDLDEFDVNDVDEVGMSLTDFADVINSNADTHDRDLSYMSHNGKSIDDHTVMTMSQDLVEAKLRYATLSQEHEELHLNLTKCERQNKQYEILIGDLKLRVAHLSEEIEDKCAVIEDLRQKFSKSNSRPP